MDQHASLAIRKAQHSDVNALIKLIAALAEFEHLTPPDAAAQERLIAHGFGASPKFEAYLAEWEGEPEPVGYAFICETYSTFLAQPTLYLEDLFVLPNFRQRGIGSALLSFSMQLADERGCGRMEWTCLNWNTAAQNIYESIGAKKMSEWLLYRMTREEIETRLLEVTQMGTY